MLKEMNTASNSVHYIYEHGADIEHLGEFLIFAGLLTTIVGTGTKIYGRYIISR